MIEVTLKTTTGKELCKLDFPSSAREVTYSKYLKVEQAFRRKEDFLKECEEKGLQITDQEYQVGYMVHVLDIVQQFTGRPEVAMIKAGDPVDSILDFFGVKKMEHIDLETSEAMVVSLYANLVRTLNSYETFAFDQKPQNFTFEYKGETYTLPGTYRDAITNNIKFDQVTVAQAVEAMDAVRVYFAHKDKDVGNQFLFTTILHLTAAFALKEGEVFPDKESDIQRFMNDRVKHLQELDMETAFNVRDFFLLGTKQYDKIQDLSGFLKTHLKRLKGQVQKRTSKEKKKTRRRLTELVTGMFTRG